MQFVLGKLAEFVAGKIYGDENIIVKGINSLELAKEGELSFIADEKHLKIAEHSHASAFLIKEGMNITGKPVIAVKNPLLNFAKIASLFMENKVNLKIGTDKNAIIGKEVYISPDCSIGPFVVIEEKVSIGKRTAISPFVYICGDVEIGANCFIYPNVTIRGKVKIGKNVIIRSGSSIGSEGFGFVKQENGTYFRVPQFGGVVIEEDVEIGANVCVDRATFGNTIIKKGTKIDNLVQIAHNDEIGENVVIAGQTGLSGSVKIGKNAILAGQVGVVDHINIGEEAVVLAGSGIHKDVPPKTVVLGAPAKEHKVTAKEWAEISLLSKLRARVHELEKRLKTLEEK